MRPRSVILYERLYIAALVIGLASVAFVWPTMVMQLAGAPIAPGTMRAIVTGAILFGLAINLLLLWLTARRASVVARILVALFFLLGIVSAIAAIANGTATGMSGILRGVQAGLQVAMLYLLFGTPDAKAWFARRAA